MNTILFPIKLISKFKNSKRSLNIKDCFDFYISRKKVECPKCSSRNNSYYYSRINSINEILTIILDREKNSNNEISFQLDFKIELSEYFLNSNNEKCELDLIGFSCYDSNKYIYYTFFKMNSEKKWYHFDGEKEKIIDIEKQNNEFSFLLFYKKVNKNC